MKTYRYLAIGPNYWGAGDTIDAAKRKLKAVGFELRRGYLVYQLEPPCSIDCDGVHGPTVPEGTTATIVADRRTKAQKARKPLS